MQAVMLAAGKGTRMLPLQTPKPLLKIAGKTILEHNLEQLEGLVEELIIVVGYKKEEIEEFLKSVKTTFTISTAEQKEQRGTFHALLQAQPLKGRFIVMNGDDLYSKKDISSCLQHPCSILAKEVSDPRRFGILETEGGKLKRIIEKPAKPPSSLANTGLYVLDRGVFDSLPQHSPREEVELTDAVNKLAESKSIAIEKAEGWLPIGYPWDLLEANDVLLKAMENNIEGEVEKDVVINGKLSLGKNSVIKSGTRLEGNTIIGENCIIGPHSYIRSSSIGDSCEIGMATEVTRSILSNNVKAKHLSFIGDSVLGEGVNIAAGTILANWRHDNKSVKCKVNGVTIDTRRRKLGAIIGNNVRTGINTSVYPGRKLSKDTLPGEIVKEDK